MMKWIILIYLAILGIEDWRKRKVSVWILCMGSVLLPGLGIYRCMQEQLMLWNMVIGMIPGVLMLLTAWLTQKAGYGDGVVLLQVGLCEGYRSVFGVFGFSLLVLSGASILLLLLRKVRKETQMPYIAFLAVAYGYWVLNKS